MNKEETIAAAKAAGVERTDEQFEAMTKADIQKAIDEKTSASGEDPKKGNDTKGSDEQKEAAAKKAPVEKKDAEESKKAAAKLEKDLAHVWKSYPTRDKLFSTTDGQVFLNKSHADYHQVSSLKGKASQVKTHEK